MRNIRAIFVKQIRDTLKNKTILIQFTMIPVLTVVMQNFVKIEEMPENFFTELFAVMFIGMAPLVSIAAVVSEEEEKGTLRALLMAGVRPFEYLAGVGGYIWLACMAGGAVISFTGNYTTTQRLAFLGIMALGIIVSMSIGAACGVIGKTQMTTTSISIPLMMLFSFLPMLSMFNETIEKIAKFTYTYQLKMLFTDICAESASEGNWLVICINGILALAFFALAYKKNGLE